MPDCDMEIFVSNRFHEHALESRPPQQCVMEYLGFGYIVARDTSVRAFRIRRKVDTITTHKNPKLTMANKPLTRIMRVDAFSQIDFNSKFVIETNIVSFVHSQRCLFSNFCCAIVGVK